MTKIYASIEYRKYVSSQNQLENMDEYSPCFFDENIYREFRNKKDKFQAKINDSDDLSLRSLNYRIIPMRIILDYIICNIYNIYNYHADKRSLKITKFYQENVRETLMKRLEDNRLINWWYCFCDLLYVSNEGKVAGSTLYSSASIAMWGFSEIDPLRKYCMYELKKYFDIDAVKYHLGYKLRRIDKINKPTDEDIIACLIHDDNIRKEKPEEEEDLNAYILSNALRRPIIILENKNEFNSINVYLPMMHNPDECCKYPLILAYYMGEYFPLLQMEMINNKRSFVPLEVESGCYLADIPFYESGKYIPLEDRIMLLERYMNVVIRYGEPTSEENGNNAQHKKYACALLGPSNDPSYYDAFRRFKMKEIGIMEDYRAAAHIP